MTVHNAPTGLVANPTSNFVITKTDLSSAAGFDRLATLENIACVRPGMLVLEVSSRTGEGMNEWLAILDAKRCAKRRLPEESVVA